MFSKGYLRIGRFGAARILVHWSTPLGLLFFTRFRWAPGAWLGMALLILIHELGHAVAVRLSRQRVISAEINAFGGLCWWDGYPTPTQRAMIAWGGVIAQAAAGALVLIGAALVRPPGSAFERDLIDVFGMANLWMILLNLLPIPPLDGAEAWRIVPILASRLRRRRELAAARARAADATRVELRSLDDAEELPPMPDEVKRVLERVMAQGRAQQEAEKKTK